MERRNQTMAKKKKINTGKQLNKKRPNWSGVLSVSLLICSVTTSGMAVMADDSSADTTTPNETVSTEKSVESTSSTETTASTQAMTPTIPNIRPAMASAAATEEADTKASASVTLSRTTIGKDGVGVDDGSQEGAINVNFTFSGDAGDVFRIEIPYGTAYYLSTVPEVPAGMGKTTITNDGTKKAYIITNTLTATASIEQKFSLSEDSNYRDRERPMSEIGTLTKTINWWINEAQQKPLTFQQIVKPSMAPTTPIRKRPDVVTNPAIDVNTDYTYEFSVNESPGIKNDGHATGQVNSAVNYGTTITIPVPEGFILNETLTVSLNNFNSNEKLKGTTITQPGGRSQPVIITVPKGVGSQGWEYTPPYKIAGRYDVERTDVEQTLAATGNIKIDQFLSDDHQQHLTAEVPSWSEKILANDAVTVGNFGLGGQPNNIAAELLQDDDSTNNPAILNWFSFENGSIYGITDLDFTFRFDDGLNVTGIRTPKEEVSSSIYLNQLKTFDAVLNYTDGTKSEIKGVTAGETIQAESGKSIKEAVLSPNLIVPGAITSTLSGNSLKGDYGPTGQNNVTNEFIVYGNLEKTYDNGEPVERGTKLTSSIQATSTAYNLSSQEVKVVQTVIAPEDLRASIDAWVQQGSQLAGVEDAGYIKPYNRADNRETTDYIFEPILYFVLPKGTTYHSSTGIKGNPNISTYVTDDGRVGVKYDYTGTGFNYPTGENGINYVHLNNNLDVKPGKYPVDFYITSPKTQLLLTEKVTDTSYTAGDASAVRFGGGTWTITAASSTQHFNLSQGNKDDLPVKSGSSDDHQTNKMSFYGNVLNNTTTDLTNIKYLFNLPTAGDSFGSQFTFKMTGPVQLPEGLAATALYSTKSPTITKETPSTTDYVSASEVTDWSTIRSVIVEIPKLAANTETGRIEIPGKDPTLLKDAGKTAYLQSGMYPGGMESLLITTKEKAAQIKVSGQSTVTARFHYVDEEGKDQYIPLDDLKQTLNDNVDPLIDNYPDTNEELTATDKGLIPKGYQLVEKSKQVINTTTVYDENFPNQPAVIGNVATYDFDGDIVQIELEKIKVPLPETGGIGILPFILTGLTFVGISGLYLLIRKRKEGEQG